MSDPTDTAGAGSSRAESTMLRQFVMEYLQSHGFDKALEMFRQGIAGDNGPDPAEGGPGGSADGALHREAIVRAPEPVPIESTLKRNIPQAQTASSSTLSNRITPEFEAQAKYIIDQLQKSADAKANQGTAPGADEDADDLGVTSKEMLLDVSDRVDGYRRYRRWVDDGLDLWKTELDGISFPLFAYTFLELIGFGFHRAAKNFFESNKTHHDTLHHQDIITLSSISSKRHVASNYLCQRLLGGKYTVTMSRNSHDLLLQWLSGAGLDDGWEAGLQSAAGRAKEAVKGIIYSHIDITVAQQPMPLDKAALIASSGLLSDLVGKKNLQTFNATSLKLGPAPMTEKLREQVLRTIQDEDAEKNGTSGEANGDGPNGDHSTAPAENGDVEMGGSPSATRGSSVLPAKSPTAVPEVKIEEEESSDLVSPEEGETVPPVPAVFRIADLKREVEAIRDKRKMIRLGSTMVEGKGGPSTVLPSVVAFTVFDSGEGISSVEFSHDASLMAAGSSESSVRIWSLKNEKLKAKSLDPSDGSLTEDEGLPMRKLIGHSGPVYGLSFDPIYGTSQAPSSLLTSSQDGTVRLWSLDTYTNLVVYRGHGRDPVWDVTWGPMGAYFATASRDRTARLWSSDRVTPLRMYTGHLSDVNTVKFHPNSLYLATGSNDNSCRLWDVQRGGCIRLFMGHTDAVTCLAVSPDGRTLASAGLDSSIWLWDLGSSRPIKKMTGHRGAIHTLSWSAESNLVVSGGADSTVRVWDAKSSGGERRGSMRGANGDTLRSATAEQMSVSGLERGGLPMGAGDTRDDGDASSDLLSIFRTKRTPIIKAHYTPRNLCMVAGTFVPPSNATVQEA